MSTQLTKYYEASIEDGSCAAGEAIAVITTSRVDRDAEVVIPTGGRLQNYRRNPVLMYGHAKGLPSEGEVGLPVGSNIWIKPTEDGLGLKAKHLFDLQGRFSSEVCGKVKRDFLRTYSITFLPIRSAPPTRDEIRRNPEWAKAKMIYHEWELIEYSIVAMPANVDAVNIAKTGRNTVDEETAIPDEGDGGSSVPAPIELIPTDPVVIEQIIEAIVEKAVSKEDDGGGEEEMAFKPGDHVKCKAPHFKGYGKCMSIHRDGMVPDVDEDMLGSKEEPCCRVKCYKSVDGGFVPTKIHKGMLAKHCEKCDALAAPAKTKGATLPDPSSLGWSPEQKALYLASKIQSSDFQRSVQAQVATLIDTQVLGRP